MTDGVKEYDPYDEEPVIKTEDDDGGHDEEDDEVNVDDLAKIFAQTNKFSMRDIDMYL